MRQRIYYYGLVAVIVLTAATYYLKSQPAMLYKNQGISEELARVSSLDADRDLQNAIANSEYRFIAAPSVFGVLLGHDDPLVELKGSIGIGGTGDFSTGPEHRAMQQKAKQYAEAYNKKLYQYLLSRKSADKDVDAILNQVEATLQRLEKTNPTQQLEADLANGKAVFIAVTDPKYTIPGADEQDIDKLGANYTGRRTLLLSRDLMDSNQYRRFQKIIDHYVKPYNTLLLISLKNRPVGDSSKR